MIKSAEPRALIEEFVDLAIQRRRRAVPADVKARMEQLEDRLRDVIDGARPGAKRIENPSAAPATRKDHNVAPAVLDIHPTTEPSPPLDMSVDMTAADQAKTNAVSTADLTTNYTPAKTPTFLNDYYAPSVVPAKLSPTEVPHRVITADGSPPEITVQARQLLGVGIPSAQAPRRKTLAANPELASLSTTEDLVGPSQTNDVSKLPVARPAARTAPPAPPAPGGPPASVYLLDGTSTRGVIPAFNPSAGAVQLYVQGRPVQYDLQQIMVLLFRVEPGRTPTPIEGDRVRVKLVNDREISGVTPDYREGAMALTVVPSPRQRNIDRMWIPAWAVKSIEMDAAG